MGDFYKWALRRRGGDVIGGTYWVFVMCCNVCECVNERDGGVGE